MRPVSPIARESAQFLSKYLIWVNDGPTPSSYKEEVSYQAFIDILQVACERALISQLGAAQFRPPKVQDLRRGCRSVVTHSEWR
jgi:hypothetical protein